MRLLLMLKQTQISKLLEPMSVYRKTHLREPQKVQRAGTHKHKPRISEAEAGEPLMLKQTQISKLNKPWTLKHKSRKLID